MSINAHLLNRIATVKRATRVPDGQGGVSRATLSNISTATPCRVQMAGAKEASDARHGADMSHVLYALPDADIARGDVLHMNDGPEVFEVLAAGHPSVSHHLKAFLKQRQEK